MRKLFIFLIAIIALSLIVSGSILLFKNANASPPAQISCHALKENQGGINIVYFSSEEAAAKYTNYLLSVSPFSENPQKFSFYYVPPQDYRPSCERYQGIAILCQSSELTRAASVCPNDYLVVLDNEPNSIRSSAYRGVMSLNINHPLSVYAHEFGHVLADFAEEYLSPGAGVPYGSQNCQKSCENFNKFEGEFGCNKECTESEYFREFDNGFMRTLSAQRYGPYDELLLEEEVNSQFRGSPSLTGSVISQANCANQQYYLIEGTPQTGFTTSLETGCPNGAKKHGQNTYEVTDSEGNIISSNSLHSDTLFTTDLNSDGDITSPPQTFSSPIKLTFPYTGLEDSLIIRDKEGEIIEQISLKDAGVRPCKN